MDATPLPGQFILTGSHQLELRGALTQTLAGRTALLTLLPLTLSELGQTDPDPARHVWQGFMPGLHAASMDVGRFYRNYFHTYVERDVRQMIRIKDQLLFEKFVRLCAARVGQLFNASSLSTEVGVSAHTIGEWLSILEASFILFRLPPYFENFGKRLIKSSKIYFIDTGLACSLLGLDNPTQVERDPLWGSLFENMVVIEYLKTKLNAGKDSNLFFFRDNHGHEVDLIFSEERKLNPIEIKAAATWQGRFLDNLNFFQKLIPSDRAAPPTVVYAGKESRDTGNYRLLPYTQKNCEKP